MRHGLHMLGSTVGSDLLAPFPWEGGSLPAAAATTQPTSPSTPGPWRDGYSFPPAPSPTAPPPTAPQKSYTAWYVAGGVAVLAATVAFLVGAHK